MKISENFIVKAGRDFGEAGLVWADNLPRCIANCKDKWQLDHLQPVQNLSINFICYAQSNIFGNVVLKLQGPHAERLTEPIALRLFRGLRVCKLHDADQELAALLLKRIMPGGSLRSIPNKKEQLRIGAELVTELPVPVSSDHDLPTYRKWITSAIEKILPRDTADQRLVDLMFTAERILGEISPPDAPHYLLHGDLHHDNILHSHQSGWKIIDPHGVIGLPFMESARFIQNHIMGENNELIFADLDATVGYFARKMAQPKRFIASGLFILHALSTCWDVETNFPQDLISKRIVECERLLKYIDVSKNPD